MKKLNIPLIAGLMIGSMGSVVGIYLLHGYQVNRSVSGLLERAALAEKEGDVDEQIKMMRRYMLHRPEDLEQLKTLLKVSRERLLTADNVNLRELQMLRDAIERAIREHPDDEGLRREGFEFNMSVGLWADAAQHIEQLAALNFAKPEDELKWATCLYRITEVDQAMEKLARLVGFNLDALEFEEGKATAPQLTDAYTFLAGIYKQEKAEHNDTTVPMKILDKMVERNSKNAEAYLGRASFLEAMETPNMEQISKDIAEAEKLAPDEPAVIIAAARRAMQDRDLAKAETVLQRGLKQAPDNPRMYMGLGDLYLTMEQPEKALEVVNQGLQKQMHPDLLWMRANMELDANDLTKAQETINRLAQGKGGDRVGQVQLLRSRMMMAKGDVAAAVTSLEKLLPLLDTSPMLRNRATRLLTDGYKRLNRWDKVAQLVGNTQADSSGKFNGDQVLTRAEALQSQGDVEGALPLYLELLQHEDELTPKGRELVFGRVFQLRIAQQVAKPAQSRNWSEVDRMAEMLIKRDDIPEEAKEQLRIDLLMQKGQLADARRAAERAVAKYPRQPSFLMLLNRLTTDSQQAMQLLNQVEQLKGDSAELRLARADRYVQDGGDDLKDKLAKLEENADKLSLNDQMQLWVGLAQAQDRIGETASAVNLWKKTLAKPGNENNLIVRQTIFDLAVRGGLEDVMEEMITEIGRIAGESSSEVLMMQASRQVWRVQQKKAEVSVLSDVSAQIERIRAARPDFAPVYGLQAEVYLLTKKPDLAVESLETALSKRPGDPRFLRKIIDVLSQLGRTQEAAQYLSQLPEGQRQGNDLLNELRVLLAENPARAYERVKEFVPDDSQDPDQLLLRAEVESATQHGADAVKSLERLLQIDPKQSRAWLLLVRSLVDLNRKDEAVAAIARLSKVVPDADRTLLVGQCYSTVGDLTAAAKTFDEGLQADPDNQVLLRNRILIDVGLNKIAEAQSGLDRFLASVEGPAPENHEGQVWARRLKAQLLNKSGTYQDFLAALDLLDKNINPTTGTIYESDLKLWLLYAARRPEAESRRKAFNRLTELASQRRLSDAESLILAGLHKADGRWDDAKRLMVNIVATNPNNMEYMSTFMEWLLERGDFTDANVWLSKLDANSPAVIRYRAIILAKQGKHADAGRLVLAAVPSKLPLGSAVELLEELGAENPSFFKVADAQWKKLVQQTPAAKTAYMAFLTRYPKGAKLPDAFTGIDGELKEKLAQKDAGTSLELIKLGLNGLRTHRKFVEKDSPLYKRVAGWIEQARAVDSLDPQTLTWYEIDYHDIRQDYKRLETIYLGLLKDPKLSDYEKALIRNNLAYGYAITNQGDKALETIGNAISQLGPRSDFLDTRGLAYLSSNKIDLALKDLQDAVAGGEGTASTYFHLALAEWKGKNIPGAREALDRATQMGLTESELSPSEATLYKQMQESLNGAKTKPAANKNATEK